MEQLIINYVKSLGIAVVLKKDVWHLEMNSFHVEFIGRDDQYYSFFCLFNEVSIYSFNGQKYGYCNETEPSNLREELRNSLCIYESKEAWMQNRRSDVKIRELIVQFAEVFKNGMNLEYSSEEFYVSASTLYTKPSIGISIIVNNHDGPQFSYLFMAGCKTEVHHRVFPFLEEAGFGDFIICLKKEDRKYVKGTTRAIQNFRRVSGC